MPFSCFLRYFKKRWNIKTSLIDVFASFIFLSTSRIQITSFNFLIPTYVYTMPINDNATQPTIKLYLFSAPSVEYFGREHFPFAVLALIVLLALAVLPMVLLFVYPFRCFQKLLNRYNLFCAHSWTCSRAASRTEQRALVTIAHSLLSFSSRD